MRRDSLAAIAIAASLVLGSADARADEGEGEGEAPAPDRLPVAHAERPLTLPRLVLEPHARFDVSRQGPTLVSLGLGAAFGVTDDFEVEAVVAPLQLSPSITYGQAGQPGPRVGATYRLVARRTQLALHIDATDITLPHTSGVILRPGIPIHSRSGDNVRLDYGLFLRATVGRTTTWGFDTPFAVAVNLSPPLYVGFRTGFTIESTQNPLAFAFPLGAFAGYTIRGKDGPVLDIAPFFVWPKLMTFATQTQSTTSIFRVGVEVRGFFYL